MPRLPRGRRRSALAATAAVVVAVLVVIVAAGLLRDDPQPTMIPIPGSSSESFADPFSYTEERGGEMAEQAATGVAHSLYRFSPGGAAASAARTARWRPQIEQAAAEAGVSADRLEGLVFLESAGRPDAITSFGIEGAVGLTQIVSGTATQMLGMEVDVTRSRSLTRRIRRAKRRGDAERVRRLERLRRKVDPRFDPQAALDGAARYLTIARERYGREDLAFVSYHMGLGNLDGVIRSYADEPEAPIREVIEDGEIDWPRLYFDSTPRRNRAAYRKLTGFADDSSRYFFKIEAARRIMELWRDDREQLGSTAELMTAKGSAEEFLRPASETEAYATPEELQQAWDDGKLRKLPPNDAVTGLTTDTRMGELSRRLDQPASLYRGLRPEALAVALYIGAQVRALGDGGALVVTSTVRDRRYQGLLVRRNIQATRSYSLHTTGYSFDIRRSYSSREQALAFQWVLDRLSVLGVIAWAREPDAIHITVGERGEELLPLLEGSTLEVG